MWLVVLMYALLASTFVVAKCVLVYINPMFLIGFRMTLAGTILLGYLSIFDRAKLRIKKKDIFLFCRVAFFHIYLAFLCEFWAMQYMTSSKTTLLYTATPFLAAFLSYLLLGEKLTLKKGFSMVAGLLGLLPILILKTAGEAGWEIPGINISFPEIVLMIAVISAAYAWFDIKKLMAKGYALLLINGSAMALGGIGALITCAIVKGPQGFVVEEWKPFLGYVLLLILLSNILFYNMFGWLLQKYSITFLTFAGLLSPVFGAIYGHVFLQDEITWHYGASLAILSTTLYLFYQDELRLRARPSTTQPVAPAIDPLI